MKLNRQEQIIFKSLKDAFLCTLALAIGLVLAILSIGLLLSFCLFYPPLGVFAVFMTFFVLSYIENNKRL